MSPLGALLTILASLALECEGRTRHHTHMRKHETPKPNIVFILTDDQDTQLGGMTPLVKTRKLIGNHGISFINAFASTPICCPSRSSILTGRYQHNHHVLNNTVAGNCNGPAWQEGPERDAFPVYLKQANYSTFYLGKYLNVYGSNKAGGIDHVPPGWDQWIGLVGNSKYYNYTLSVNGVPEVHMNDPEKDYLTDVITTRAKMFLEAYEPSSGPLFMMLSPPASHAPFTPHAKYAKYFSELKAPRTPHYNISGGADKHWFIRHTPQFLKDDVATYVDEVFRDRWRTLLSVDDMVESVIETLEEKNMMENTYIVFASDHGYHLGQFSLPLDKRQAYEFDIRIPLMIRGPGIDPGITQEEVVVTIDLAPTFLHLAGIPQPPQMDGKSLVPLFKPGEHSWRSAFLVEYVGESTYGRMHMCPQYSHSGMFNCFPSCICQDAVNNTYTCLRSLSQKSNYMYCVFEDEEKYTEMYDLSADPYELHNLAYDTLEDNVNSRNYLNRALEQMKKCQGLPCFES